MSFILIDQFLTIAVVVALVIWTRRKGSRGPSNVTTVTIGALSALVCVTLSHNAMYLKIGAGLLTGTLWMLAYRFRDQEQVVITALIGIGAIVILS